MKKLIAFLLILVVLIAIFFIGINISKNNINNQTDEKENQDNNPDTGITGGIIKDDSEKNQPGTNGNFVGDGEAVSAGNDIPPDNKNQELPFDLNTRPCGFYFSEYNVCAGTCPNGQCLVDDKSCYCQIVP